MSSIDFEFCLEDYMVDYEIMGLDGDLVGNMNKILLENLLETTLDEAYYRVIVNVDEENQNINLYCNLDLEEGIKLIKINIYENDVAFRLYRIISNL